MSFDPRFSPASVEESILLIPAISTAHVPQLCADMFIHSVDFERVAVLSDKYLSSFASPVDHTKQEPSAKGITVALECYKSKTHNISILQQRSPAIPGCVSKHFSEVVIPFVKQGRFSMVLFMDSQPAAGNYPSGIEKFADTSIEGAFSTLTVSSTETYENGFRPLADAIAKSKSFKGLVGELQDVLPVVYFMMYVYNGDGQSDAQKFASAIANFLKVKPEWKQPVSWIR